MDFSTFARSRKSTRGFKPDPIPVSLIRIFANLCVFCTEGAYTRKFAYSSGVIRERAFYGRNSPGFLRRGGTADS